MTARATVPTLVCCAYDGSVNAHWVARYAIRLAAATQRRELRLVHVEDGHLSQALFARKLEHVLGECAHAGIEATLHSVRPTRPVAEAILASTPPGADTLLVCGTRARPRRGGFLAGTVSHALLGAGACSVLALRVVSPGLLGSPRRLLLPVAGTPGEGRDLARFVSLLAPGARELNLLRVMLTDEHTARHAPLEAMTRLRQHGRAAVTSIENELRAGADLSAVHVDALVRVAESWSRSAIVSAAQHRCDLMLVRASARALAGRGELEIVLAHAPCDVGVWHAGG